MKIDRNHILSSLSENNALVFYGFIYNFSLNLLSEYLTSEEADRASRFQMTDDRNRFIVSRAILRKFLSLLTDFDTSEIQFGCNFYGKPYLRNINDIQFNLAHSNDIILWGLTKRKPIGVDVESLDRELNVDKLLSYCCTHNEELEIRNAPSRLRHEHFINCWTRKESLLKAIGCGLSGALDQLEVSLSNVGAPELLSTGSLNINKKDWIMKSFNLPHRYRACVTVEAPSKNISIIDINSIRDLDIQIERSLVSH